jgi:GMP synthase (glutamine-hydrolysing)
MKTKNKNDLHRQKVLILDFGSQYTQLIARRVRELKVYCEIHPFSLSRDQILSHAPRGIILSGGPSSVYEPGAPLPDPELFALNIPILGICYGMQVMAHLLQGKVAHAGSREYGPALLAIKQNTPLLAGWEPVDNRVWMSHGDRIDLLPKGFQTLAESPNSPVAAMGDPDRSLFGVQFHPEVVHTPSGKRLLRNFLVKICGIKPVWDMGSFIETTVQDLKSRIGEDQVLCALSGGVDSTVTAVLLHQAIGSRLNCLFVNNGVLRKNEAEEVLEVFRTDLHLPITYVDAEEKFLEALEGVIDPEEKRKIIGRMFIEVFEEEAKRFGRIPYLAQGTLYPDVIESISIKGPSATIKSHHNVGGLPEVMAMTLIEPLKDLFKDEAREVGKKLGIPPKILYRHPFPGPGLAIRILGQVTPKSLDILREADAIVVEEIEKSGLYREIWQAFAVLLPIHTVGVMGDERTYDQVVVLRVVNSQDAMTADWTRLPYPLLARISNRIINEVKGVNRVVYDISSKPPSTIEWE